MMKPKDLLKHLEKGNRTEEVLAVEVNPNNATVGHMYQQQGRQCFDSYEVAHIKTVHDPLLFGRIEGCPDRFFIAQWDDDVKITDLIGPNEG